MRGVPSNIRGSGGDSVFNLGESQTVTLSQLIELLEKSIGKKAIINRQPQQPGDVPITFADVSKARAKLEYNPRVKIAEGIPLFVEWFQKIKTRVSPS